MLCKGYFMSLKAFKHAAVHRAHYKHATIPTIQNFTSRVIIHFFLFYEYFLNMNENLCK